MTTPPDDNEKPKLVFAQVDQSLMDDLTNLINKTTREFFKKAVQEKKVALPTAMQMQYAAIAALQVSWSLTYIVSDDNKPEALEAMSRNLNTITAEYE